MGEHEREGGLEEHHLIPGVELPEEDGPEEMDEDLKTYYDELARERRRRRLS